MNIIGIGTDMVQQSRIRLLYERYGERFINRILSLDEQRIFNTLNQPCAFLAKRFAAKEAVSKALGIGIGEKLAFNEISVTNLSSGQPQVTLLGKAEILGINKSIHISLSDEKDYALAFVVICQ
jgi:holo-[acyl-carrier protein] synthase